MYLAISRRQTSSIFSKFSMKNSGLTCARYELLGKLRIMRLCSFSSGSSALLEASPQVDIQY